MLARAGVVYVVFNHPAYVIFRAIRGHIYFPLITRIITDWENIFFVLPTNAACCIYMGKDKKSSLIFFIFL
jgi:hypothetical protein